MAQAHTPTCCVVSSTHSNCHMLVHIRTVLQHVSDHVLSHTYAHTVQVHALSLICTYIGKERVSQCLLRKNTHNLSLLLSLLLSLSLWSSFSLSISHTHTLTVCVCVCVCVCRRMSRPCWRTPRLLLSTWRRSPSTSDSLKGSRLWQVRPEHVSSVYLRAVLYSTQHIPNTHHAETLSEFLNSGSQST